MKETDEFDRKDLRVDAQVEGRNVGLSFCAGGFRHDVDRSGRPDRLHPRLHGCLSVCHLVECGINEYAVDYQSGALVAITGSPVSAGNNPVSIVATTNGLFLYVLNQGDSTVQEFAIDSDGKLTSKNTYKTGTRPTAIAIDAANKFLYVTYTYQTGYSAANPGPGGVTIFPISADNSLGTPTNLNVGNNPTGITATHFNNYVYVIDAEPAVGSASPFGQILAFSQNATSGALTPIGATKISVDASGRTVASGYGAGTVPSSIASDPASRFVYVTDRATNQLYGNIVLSGGTAAGDAELALCDWVASGCGYGRSSRQVPVRIQFQRQHGRRLRHRPVDGRSSRFGRVGFDEGGDGTDMPSDRAGAWHLSLLVEQPRQYNDRPATGSAQRHVEERPEHAVPWQRNTDVRRGGGKWLACHAGRQSVELDTDC